MIGSLGVITGEIGCQSEDCVGYWDSERSNGSEGAPWVGGPMGFKLLAVGSI